MSWESISSGYNGLWDITEDYKLLPVENYLSEKVSFNTPSTRGKLQDALFLQGPEVPL